MRPVAFHIPRPIRAFRPALPRPQFKRFQSQVVHRSNGEVIRRQDVHFKKPSVFNWRRLVTFCMYGASVYLTLKYVPRLAGFDVSVELVNDDEHEETAAEDGEREGIELTEEDLEAAEDSLFIPMTWAQKMPKTYYKGTDAEWQEFIRISNDSNRQKKITAELLTLFSSSAKKNQGISRQLGGNIKPGKHWLDMHFPDGPPQEYMRSGVEFGDGYIAWSRQRIQQEKQHRILRALWPTALFNSALAMSKVVVDMQWQHIAHALGLKAADSTSFEEKVKAAAAMMNKAARERKGLPKAQTDPDDSPGELSSSGAPRRSEPTERAQKALWPLPPVQLPQPGDSEAADQSKLRVAIATHVFARTLAKGWNPKKVDPPKGTFVVHGIIELHGKNGRMSFDVQALYDPKQNKYLNLNAGLRHFKRWKQAPRGGN